MRRTVRGRVALSAKDRGQPFELIRAHDGSRVAVDAEGKFSIDFGGEDGTTSAEEPLRLIVRRGPGGASDIVLDPSLFAGEMIIVLPEPVSDPREVVTTVTERLAAERAARASARSGIAAELKARTRDDAAIDTAVNAVLMGVAARTGGDLTWRADPDFAADPTILIRLTEKAVASATSTMNAAKPVARAKPGGFTSGEKLSSNDLVTRLTGAPTKELFRRPALATASIRRAVMDADGLPLPIPSTRGSNGGGSSTNPATTDVREIETLVTGKVTALVHAMRLPEDPPLLQADSAVTGSGAQVELARGIADAVAFHDFHELVLAMPNIWTEVFDKRFITTIRQAVTELSIAGMDVSEVATNLNGRAPEILLRNLRALSTTYAETNAAALRSAVPHTRRSTLDGPGHLVGSSDALLARRGGDDFDVAPDRFRPLRPVPPVHTPPEVGPLLDPDRGPSGLLEELEGYLSGSHSFTVFPAHGTQRALNFGVLLTWRQRWEPLSYQTGEIAHTLTLAPGERRKVVTRRVRRLKRYTSEAEKSLQSRRFETNETNRAESEILRKADTTTNFQLTSDGSTKLLVENGSFHTSTTRDINKGGNESRRRFREAVIKAAQEYRDEHSLEVRTETEESLEEETTSEVHNPNDELAVTAVFYALQRRYQVSEHLYRARPIVMVAMPVPNPSEITTAWLVRYAWIIARSLLADKFQAALTYLTTSFLGDTEALNALRLAVNDQRTALTAAQGRLRSSRALLESRGDYLRSVRQSLAAGEDPSLIEGVPVLKQVGQALDFVGGLFGGDDEADKREREGLVLAAAEEELDRAERQAQEAEANLHSATNAYQDSVRTYVEAKRTQRNHEVRIAELRIHVADNILYYMQAIWATQPPDQRFFELHTVQVPDLNDQVTVTSTGNAGSPGIGGFTPQEFTVSFDQGNTPLAFRPLAEVAELDQPLGFKGNYALFPMRQGNALTDVILAPYLDSHEILSDPGDPAANWTLEELRRYADHLRDLVTAGTMSQAVFDRDHAPFLRRVLEELITDPRPAESMVIVPTDSLYAELLTSGGSLIEPFKKEHRSLDVSKVRAEIRELELENLRKALRIEKGELADPDIDDFERHLLRTSAAPDS